jgi:dUTP pyrophosphatase
VRIFLESYNQSPLQRSISMNFKPLHPNFKAPIKATKDSAAFDIYMPTSGIVFGKVELIPLGFAAAIPKGYVGLLLPRSGVGAKHGLELNNTCGVIDADYRGEWKAAMRTKSGESFQWLEGDRVLQCLVVPALSVDINIVEELDDTDRADGGFGHSGT